jgi:tetratricopeptide (TPR) repeat protein
LIGVISTEFHDNGRYRGTANAVATTWLVSFDQIRRSDAAAAELLMFISYIEPKAIPQSILPSMESRHIMTQAIGTLCSYAFFSRRGQSSVYDMHSLVHLATRVWIQKHKHIEEIAARALRHVAEVFPTDDHENRNMWREYMPHALKLVQGSEDLEEKYNLYYWIGRCLHVDGRVREAVDCFERYYLWKEKTLDETHLDRLASQHDLALAYKANGQVAKAVALLEKVVEIQRKTLDETHPSRLASQHNLANAYQDNGQVAKAVALLEKVVEIQRKILDETHPSRLASQHDLANAYRANGQVAKAVTLLEKVPRPARFVA